MANIFNVGSTGAVGTIEYEPGLEKDLPGMLDKLFPPSRDYGHEHAWHDGNGHSHLLTDRNLLLRAGRTQRCAGEVTADYQSQLQVRSPILVGFFLAGLVIHGGLQQWWIAPVLGRLNALPLML